MENKTGKILLIVGAVIVLLLILPLVLYLTDQIEYVHGPVSEPKLTRIFSGDRDIHPIYAMSVAGIGVLMIIVGTVVSIINSRNRTKKQKGEHLVEEWSDVESQEERSAENLKQTEKSRTQI